MGYKTINTMYFSATKNIICQEMKIEIPLI